MGKERLRAVGRYVLFDKIAAGGMASVYLGRLRGAAGFVRTVAIKRLHPSLTRDPETVAMLIDEAHIASRIRAPNVVPILDVTSEEGELFLVMEYVHGESLGKLLHEVRARGETVPPAIASGIVSGLLHGLHAAHEARGDDGAPLDIVHRDVSPQNVMVGVDGVSRVVDFGIAKAATRAQTTQEGQIKGKLGYMAPEQLRAAHVDRRTDVFAAGIVLAEMLAGRRLFDGDDAGAIVGRILLGNVPVPSRLREGVSSSLDAVVARAMSHEIEGRFSTARAFAEALEAAEPPASAHDIGEWVRRMAGESLTARSAMLAALDAPDPARAGAVPSSEEPTAPGKPAVSVDPADATARSVTRDDVPVLVPLPARRSPWGIALVAIASAAVGALAIAAWPTSERAGANAGALPREPEQARVEAAAASSAPLSAALPAPASASAAASASGPSVPVRPARPPAPPKVHEKGGGCDPPYVMKNGIKEFKPECL